MAVTTCAEDGWIARNGTESLFHTLKRVLPEVIQPEVKGHRFRLKGRISGSEFNKLLQGCCGFVCARTRRKNLTRSAGNWLFCDRRWLDPADPLDRVKLEANYDALCAACPEFAICSRPAFLSIIAEVVSAWSAITDGAGLAREGAAVMSYGSCSDTETAAVLSANAEPPPSHASTFGSGARTIAKKQGRRRALRAVQAAPRAGVAESLDWVPVLEAAADLEDRLGGGEGWACAGGVGPLAGTDSRGDGKGVLRPKALRPAASTGFILAEAAPTAAAGRSCSDSVCTAWNWAENAPFRIMQCTDTIVGEGGGGGEAGGFQLSVKTPNDGGGGVGNARLDRSAAAEKRIMCAFAEPSSAASPGETAAPEAQTVQSRRLQGSPTSSVAWGADSCGEKGRLGVDVPGSPTQHGLPAAADCAHNLVAAAGTVASCFCLAAPPLLPSLVTSVPPLFGPRDVAVARLGTAVAAPHGPRETVAASQSFSSSRPQTAFKFLVRGSSGGAFAQVARKKAVAEAAAPLTLPSLGPIHDPSGLAAGSSKERLHGCDSASSSSRRRSTMFPDLAAASAAEAIMTISKILNSPRMSAEDGKPEATRVAVAAAALVDLLRTPSRTHELLSTTPSVPGSAFATARPCLGAIAASVSRVEGGQRMAASQVSQATLTLSAANCYDIGGGKRRSCSVPGARDWAHQIEPKLAKENRIARNEDPPAAYDISAQTDSCATLNVIAAESVGESESEGRTAGESARVLWQIQRAGLDSAVEFVPAKRRYSDALGADAFAE